MLNKLQAVCNKYEELCARSEQPDFYTDPKKAAKQLREKNDLEPIVETFRRYKKTRQELADLRDMLDGQLDPEMRELCQEEFTQSKKDLEDLEEQLNETGWVETYQNGENQSGMKKAAAADVHISLTKNLNAIVKQLLDLVPPAQKTSRLEAMMKK